MLNHNHLALFRAVAEAGGFSRAAEIVHVSQPAISMQVAELEEAERAMRELRGLQRGQLALGASTTIGSYLLPAILGKFRQRHPSVELALTIDNTEGIRQRLLDRTLDLGMTEGMPRRLWN